MRERIDEIDSSAWRSGAAAPARRHGPRAPLRRGGAGGAGDHPPGRDERLRRRQHRPDPAPRGDAAGAEADRGDHRRLADFARRYRSLPTLAYTHFQPAQPTTVGKRATLWIQDLLLDLEEVEHRLATLRFRGIRGTTGTEASFLELFEGDHAKVVELNRRVAEKMGFEKLYWVTGQTYPRKADYAFLATLAGIATSASKFANDLRLLQHLREVEEPFGAEQIGSSAMAYKRNPMRAERINALTRHVITLSLDPAVTAATQWLERTLDDSANKRIAVPEAYLGRLPMLYHNVAAGLVVHER